MKKNKSYYIERVASILAAIILLQTLFYKFTAAPESVYIFSRLGIEPYGRVGIGVAELFVAALLLYKKTSILGAIASIGLMGGAILSHIFVLGVEVQDDRGKLFALALLVLVCSLVTFVLQKGKLKQFFYKKVQE